MGEKTKKETTAEAEEAYVSTLTPWMILLAIVMPVLFWFINMPLHSISGEWWVWPGWFPPGILVMVLIVAAVCKATGRPLPRPQYMATFFSICFIMSGFLYATYGLHSWTYFPMWTVNQGWWVLGQWDATYRTIAYDVVPSFAAPKETAVLNAFYTGGAFNFGAWFPSMAFWALWAIVCYCGGYLWMVPFAKPLVKVEKHIFPAMVPSTYTIKWSKEEGKSGLLGLSFDRSYWVGAVIGFLIFMPTAVGALTPITIPFYIAEPPINSWIQNLMIPILPGARFAGFFGTIDIPLLALAPMDVLVSAVIYYVLAGIIYPVVGVKLGILPYYPGIENTNVLQAEQGPFKAQWWAAWGVVTGVGLWMFWRYRDRWINLFRVAFTPEKYPNLPREEDGINQRLLAFGIIGSLILLMAMWVALGANPIVTVISVLYFMVIFAGWTRYMADSSHPTSLLYWYPAHYYIGQFVGAWGPMPDSRAVNTLLPMASTFGAGYNRMSATGPHTQFMVYSLANENKVRFKDVLVITIITTAVAGICVAFLTPWWYTVFGGQQRLGMINYHNWFWPWIWNMTGGTSPWKISEAEFVGYTVSGIVLVFGCFQLRAMFPWFFFNPIGIMIPAALGGVNHGMYAVWALILKYVVLKLGGVKWFEGTYTKVAVGVGAGAGIMYFISATIAFFTRTIPAMLAL